MHSVIDDIHVINLSQMLSHISSLAQNGNAQSTSEQPPRAANMAADSKFTIN